MITFCGGPGQVNDHVHLSLWLQVDLEETKTNNQFGFFSFISVIFPQLMETRIPVTVFDLGSDLE